MKINPQHLARVYREAAESIANHPVQEQGIFSCWEINRAIGLSCAYNSPEREFYTTVFDLEDSNGNKNYFDGMELPHDKRHRAGNNHRVIALLTLAAAVEAGADFGLDLV